MTIALTEDHVALAETATDFLARHAATEASRALLEASAEERPAFWSDLAGLGWTGIHLAEDVGGSGFGIDELVVIVEALGHAVAPGPFVPTAIASALIDRAAPAEVRSRLLPGFADGTTTAGTALVGEATVTGTGEGATAEGTFAAVLGAPLADVLLLPSGDDAVVVAVGEGVTIETPPNLDPTRRSARVTLTGAPATVLPGARRLLVDLGRAILSAEAVGIAASCTEQAAAYSKERIQFGRPIATFQAVKHHCANMAVATELATAAVWDAARAAAAGGEQLTIAAATAATLAGPAVDLCANLSTQVFGGIAITWEHDAHLYMRRAEVLLNLLRPTEAAEDVSDLTRRGVVRTRSVDLPPEAEAIREEVRAVVERVKDLSSDEQRRELASSGYAMPNWPAPYGRDAGAVEQLVIEQELSAAGVKRPSYGITGWNILTILQHGTADQIERWVRPALDDGVVWCQLFSEPDAGSDAAGVKTKATRVDGGWKVNGQKVWTSGAHVAAMGFATVRTDPDAKKHDGITMMAIDMHAPGVEVRPLKMVNGGAEFNEVFFDDVFVPDDDVVGPVDGGWTVARATLGNESVSIGSGDGGMALPAESLIAAHDAHPGQLDGGEARIGRYAATLAAMGLLNLRSAHRAVAGGGPGPEGAITKLVLSELGHEAAAALHELGGDDALYTDGDGFLSSTLLLMHRAMSIAGGTSEIKRNQIGERILGLPRDPLIN